MISLLGVFIIATIFFFLIVAFISYLFKFKIKKTLTYSISLFLGIPVLVVFLIYLLKSPLQQGEIPPLNDLGILLNFFVPPEDLYTPLASTELIAGTRKYNLKFTNKYVGNHGVVISSPRQEKYDFSAKSEVSLSVKIFENSKIISDKQSESTLSQFFGRVEYGFFFITYHVPDDLPVGKELSAVINISGDLESFLKKRGTGYLRVKKFSDE